VAGLMNPAFGRNVAPTVAGLGGGIVQGREQGRARVAEEQKQKGMLELMGQERERATNRDRADNMIAENEQMVARNQASRARGAALQDAIQRGDNTAITGLRSGNIDPKEYFAKVSGAGKGSFSSTEGPLVRDEAGHIYQAVFTTNRTTGEVTRELVGLGQNAPKEHEGKLTPVDNKYGQSAEETADRKVDTKTRELSADNFLSAQTDALVQIPVLRDEILNLEKATVLLDTVKTGGPINTAGTAFEKFFGTTQGNKAELQTRLGEVMYSRLKPLFGGVISEGERETIEKLYGSLGKSEEANKAILNALRVKAQEALAVQESLAGSKTYAEWQQGVLNPTVKTDFNNWEL